MGLLAHRVGNGQLQWIIQPVPAGTTGRAPSSGPPPLHPPPGQRSHSASLCVCARSCWCGWARTWGGWRASHSLGSTQGALPSSSCFICALFTRLGVPTPPRRQGLSRASRLRTVHALPGRAPVCFQRRARSAASRSPHSVPQHRAPSGHPLLCALGAVLKQFLS